MARRLGIDRLAEANITSIRRTIARWESIAVTATVPDERYQWVLAHVFSERDGQFNVGPGSDFLRLISALVAMGVPHTRIAELQDAVVSWIERRGRSPLAQIDRLALDEAAMADVTLSFLAVSGRVGKVPFTRSQLALAPFLAVLRHLTDTGKRQPTFMCSLLACSPWPGGWPLNCMTISKHVPTMPPR